MKIVTLCLFLAITATAQADVAGIHMQSIKTALERYVFEKEEYRELGIEHQKIQAKQNEFHREMLEKSQSGKMEFDFAQSFDQMDQYEFERGLADVLRRELVKLIDELNLRYDLILDTSSKDTILYSGSEIKDITSLVLTQLRIRESR